MDALALLCTLYAEGPVTLARLREGGCATIEDVIARDAQDLAPILLATEATAQRFRREAQNLHERVGAEGTSEVRSRTFDPRASGSVRSESSIVGRSSIPSAPIASSDRVDGRPSVLDRVLAAWRERDERDEHDEHTELGDAAGDGDLERLEILKPALPSRPPTSNAPRKPVEVRGIPVGAIDGLDAEASGALARADVLDLRALAVCDTLIVARTSGMSWSRLSRLRALARRVPGVAQYLDDPAQPAGEKPELTEEKVSPSERPFADQEARTTLDRDSVPDRAPQYASHAPEGAGGPFA